MMALPTRASVNRVLALHNRMQIDALACALDYWRVLETARPDQLQQTSSAASVSLHHTGGRTAGISIDL